MSEKEPLQDSIKDPVEDPDGAATAESSGESSGGSSGGSSGQRIPLIAMLIAGPLLVLLIFSLTGAGIYLGVRQGIIPIPGFVLEYITKARPPEYSARYYPRDTILYVWATPSPGGEQPEQARLIWKKLQEIQEFPEVREDLLEKIRDRLGIEPSDMKSWLGAGISAGILGYDQQGDSRRLQN